MLVAVRRAASPGGNVDNRLTRTAFNVSCNFNINVAACSAGTIIGGIPYQYRPATSKTFTTNWEIRTDTSDVTAQLQ